MDISAVTKVDDEMSQSCLQLIDEDEEALLNEAVSHTIRQLSAEIRSNNANLCASDKPDNKIREDDEMTELDENCLRIKVQHQKDNDDLLHRNENGNDQAKARTAIERIQTDEDSSSLPLRKRPREDSVNSLPAKMSRNRHNSSSSSSTNSSSTSKKKVEYETDAGTLARRQKDIDYGKNTVGYDRYIQAIPKKERAKEHPKTPPKYVKYSRRGWDGMVRLWRKQLHTWDPPEESSSAVTEETEAPDV